MSDRIFRVKSEARVQCATHLGFASVSRVPLPALLVQVVEMLVGNLLSGEVSSFRFNQPRSLSCATCFIDMPLEVVRHFVWKRGWRCGEAWRDFLHIDERLDSLRDIGDLFPVPQHREDCKHDDDGSCSHESWRVRQEALSAGFFLIGSKRNLRALQASLRSLFKSVFDPERGRLAVYMGTTKARTAATAVHNGWTVCPFWGNRTLTST